MNRMQKSFTACLALATMSAATWAEVPGKSDEALRPFAAVIDRVALANEYQVFEVDHASLLEAATLETCVLSGLPLAQLGAIDLNLERFQVIAPEARLVIVGDVTTEQFMGSGHASLWKGTVLGETDSGVFLSHSSAGLFGWVEIANQRWVISSGDPTGDRRTVIYRDGGKASQLMNWKSFVCDATGPLPEVIQEHVHHEGGLAGDSCKNVDLAIETDNEYLELFNGNQVQAQAYVETLIAATSIIYERDTDLKVSLSYLRLWTTEDPWNGTWMCEVLGEFGDYWSTQMNSVERDLAHLVSGANLGGGCASLGTSCSMQSGYAVSANMNGYFPNPIEDNSFQNWDIMVFSHELGHNLGAYHTHDENPPVDNCGNGDCSVTPNGTIMSYCHTCPGGMSNIQLRIHPRVQDRILANLADKPCIFSDSDGDGIGDGCDGCPNDPFKTDPGSCGCGSPDIDPDGDGIADCDCLYCDDEGVPYCFTTLLVPEDHATIQDALDAAPICNGTIQIAAGVWQIDQTLDTLGKAVKLVGTIDADGELLTILDGQGAIQIIRCDSGETSSTLIRNLVIQNGLAINGGGVSLVQSSPTLLNCIFRGNRSVESGAAMYNDASEPMVIGCTFSDNSAEIHGGGVFNFNCDPTFESCTFTDNNATTGGGLHNEQYSFPVIKGCTFSGNSVNGGFGGGINSNFSYPLLIDNMLCGNKPFQLSGDWLDGGGNTFMNVCVDDCPADTDGNGMVDGADLNSLLAHWDESGGIGDLNQDQKVDGLDLNILLGAWGPCQ